MFIPPRLLFRGERLTFGAENEELWKKCEKEWRAMLRLIDFWLN